MTSYTEQAAYGIFTSRSEAHKRTLALSHSGTDIHDKLQIHWNAHCTCFLQSKRKPLRVTKARTDSCFLALVRTYVTIIQTASPSDRLRTTAYTRLTRMPFNPNDATELMTSSQNENYSTAPGNAHLASSHHQATFILHQRLRLDKVIPMSTSRYDTNRQSDKL